MDLPVLFLINKTDQENYLGIDSVRQHLSIGSLNCTREVQVQEISANTKVGLVETTNWLYENIPQQVQQAKTTSTAQSAAVK